MQPLGGGDYLCARYREHRDAVREQQRRDNQVAAVVDEFAAKPGRVHNASNFDRGISPWNARPKAEPGAAYWLSLPDPEPKSSQEWRLYDETRLRPVPRLACPIAVGRFLVVEVRGADSAAPWCCFGG